MNEKRKMIATIRQDMQASHAHTDILHIIFYLLFSYNKRPLILLRLQLALAGGCRATKILRTLVAVVLRSKYHIECSCQNIGAPIRLPHPRGGNARGREHWG